jgi:hypothetical protein
MFFITIWARAIRFVRNFEFYQNILKTFHTVCHPERVSHKDGQAM